MKQPVCWRRSWGLASLLFTFYFLFFSSCSPRHPGASDNSLVNGFLYRMFNTYDPSNLLANVGRTIAPPLFANLKTQAANLVTQGATLASSCTAGNLTNFQNAWFANIAAAKKVEIFHFGPFVTYYPLFDAWPGEAMKTVSPESPPSAGDMDSLDFDYTGTYGASVAGAANYLTTLDKDAKGLIAIEYVAFIKPGSYGANQEACSDLTSIRLNLLQALLADYSANATALANAWDPAGTTRYGEQLATAGKGSTTYSYSGAALNDVFSGALRQLSTMKDGKLEKPAGLSSGGNGVINLSLSESRLSGNSVVNLRNNLASFKAVYLGNGAVGLSDYIRYYSPSLDNRAKSDITQLETVLNSFSSINSANMSAISQSVSLLSDLLNVLNVQFPAVLGNGPVSSSGGDGD